MAWTTAAAIYFIIWWVVLFAVLPFGVRNASEAGEGLHVICESPSAGNTTAFCFPFGARQRRSAWLGAPRRRSIF